MQILSINMANSPSRKYKEVWMNMAEHDRRSMPPRSAGRVLHLYDRGDGKASVMRLTRKLGGNIELAIKQLAESKRKSEIIINPLNF